MKTLADIQAAHDRLVWRHECVMRAHDRMAKIAHQAKYCGYIRCRQFGTRLVSEAHRLVRAGAELVEESHQNDTTNLSDDGLCPRGLLSYDRGRKS